MATSTRTISVERRVRIVTISEFSKFVTEMIQFEKENGDLQENIENEDWGAPQDEIYEYLASCDCD